MIPAVAAEAFQEEEGAEEVALEAVREEELAAAQEAAQGVVQEVVPEADEGMSLRVRGWKRM